MDKERKRKEKLSDLKVKLHKSLLENLNLAALENATETDLKSEIAAISTEALQELAVVLNSGDRALLYQDLYDEVMGLGPLEPLLKDETVNDILVNGPNRIFVERGGKLTLTDITFKDERHLLRIIDKIVSRIGRRIEQGGASFNELERAVIDEQVGPPASGAQERLEDTWNAVVWDGRARR
jgi:pilus assembly protein CpaF